MINPRENSLPGTNGKAVDVDCSWSLILIRIRVLAFKLELNSTKAVGMANSRANAALEDPLEEAQYFMFGILGQDLAEKHQCIENLSVSGDLMNLNDIHRRVLGIFASLFRGHVRQRGISEIRIRRFVGSVNVKPVHAHSPFMLGGEALLVVQGVLW
ncbi:MAG: hypothetical protein G01um101438_510 [Parcubacteria group bacterium Gr01-1014_38]|nr:MAG: hypothetical protein G01um101438_510 [Parcubacteria group bacterium Gr01-1014_38]